MTPLYKTYFDILYRDSDFGYTDNSSVKVIDKIKRFNQLPYRWDFGVGEAPSKEIIKDAIGIYQYGLLLGFNGDARPETDGGVILNLYTGDDFIYLTIKKDGGIDLRHEKGIGVEYEIKEDIENVSFESISKTLTNLKAQCFSSELYTTQNTTSSLEDSQAIVSNLTEAEYQYL